MAYYRRCHRYHAGGRVTTTDGVVHDVGKWDMMIAHPPCTYLSNAATRAFSLRVTPAEMVVDRWKNRALAAVFFMYFVLSDIPKTCVENPVGFMNTAYRRPDQIIHPYMFADGKDDKENFVMKRTCLWLKGLDPLKPTCAEVPDDAKRYGRYPNGKVKHWEDMVRTNRSENRSKTFSGVAKAMAEQWG